MLSSASFPMRLKANPLYSERMEASAPNRPVTESEARTPKRRSHALALLPEIKTLRPYCNKTSANHKIPSLDGIVKGKHIVLRFVV
jgi:hypothetical protein